MPVPFITERLIDAVSCVLIGFLAVAFGRRTGNPIAFFTISAVRLAFG
jgi:hypothetical protein